MKKSSPAAQQPQEARSNGYSNGPSRRRILRKDRRQTLEVLTSDDEVNEFVETRASAYIEPQTRQRLHEVKPHLRSSFETLYSPQFDALDSPAAVAKDAGWRGSWDSLDSLSDDEESEPAASSREQLDRRLWETKTPSVADNVPTERTEQRIEPQPAAALTRAAAPSSAALEEMDRLADQILRSRDEQRPGQGAYDQVDIAAPAGSSSAEQPSKSAFVFTRDVGAWTYGSIVSGRDAEVAESAPVQQALVSPPASAGKRSSPKKTVVFLLPAEQGAEQLEGGEENAMLARLRAKVNGSSSGGDGSGGGSSMTQPSSAAEKLRQLIRSQPPVYGTTNLRSAAQPMRAMSPPPLQPPLPPPPPLFDTPSQPSVTQRLRALLPASGEATVGGYAIRQQPQSPSALSAQLASTSGLSVDKHTPRRTGSLVRTGSYSSYSRQQLASGKRSVFPAREAEAAAAEAAAAAMQQPIRRTWSLERPQQDQYQQVSFQHQQNLNSPHNQQQSPHGQQNATHYQQQSQPPMRFQKATQQPFRSLPLPPPPHLPSPLLPPPPQLPPPPLPPRRQKEQAEVHARYSIRQQVQQPSQVGDCEPPSTEHVCRRIILTAREAQRHQLTVASSHYRLTRPAKAASHTSDRHRPLRGWSHSQSSASSVS